MQKRILAQALISRLNHKIQSRFNINESLILGIVLKGLPVAYSLAEENGKIENFVPIVAQRHILMQHQVESYFPSLEWKNYFSKIKHVLKRILIIDDVVNTGFTKERVESLVRSLSQEEKTGLPQTFAALILNRANLANSSFAHRSDLYALRVKASNVECDWGQTTVPLWDLPVEIALQRCEQYNQKFWKNEDRWVTITY